MRIPSGVTDQYIYFIAVDATDYATRETGLSSFTVYRSRNGGTAAAMTTPTINETDSSNMPGVYELLLDEDMTIGTGNDSEEMAFHITHAGMAPVTRTIELYRPKITAGNTLGVASDGDISGNVDGNVASVAGAVGSVTAQVTANVTAISGDSVAADNLEADYDGTGYNKSNSTIGTCTTNTDMRGTDSAYTGTPPTAAAVADAVWDEVQSGHTTGGSFGEIATEIASILADTNELQGDWVNGGRLDLILDSISSAISALNDISEAEVNAQVVDALATDTYSESSGAVAATATLAAALTWLKTLSRNEINQTATTQTLRNDADSGNIATSTVSDDGTTATRGEFS